MCPPRPDDVFSNDYDAYITTGPDSITIDTGPEDDGLDGVLATGCVLAQLETSDSVITRIQSTTSMMGTVEAEEDGLNYEFSFHPDNGLLLTVTEQ